MDDTKKKILIVDDDADTLTVMEAILLNAGYNVIKTTSGREAVGLAQTGQPDMILLDIKKPDMDGVKTTDDLKGNQSTRDIPIAYLSNVVEEEEVTDGHVLGSKIGNLYFIPKSYEPDQIVELVRQNLESSRKK